MLGINKFNPDTEGVTKVTSNTATPKIDVWGNGLQLKAAYQVAKSLHLAWVDKIDAPTLKDRWSVQAFRRLMTNESPQTFTEDAARAVDLLRGWQMASVAGTPEWIPGDALYMEAEQGYGVRIEWHMLPNGDVIIQILAGPVIHIELKCVAAGPLQVDYSSDYATKSLWLEAFKATQPIEGWLSFQVLAPYYTAAKA